MVLIFASLLTEMKQYTFLSSGQYSLNATEHSPGWHSPKYGSQAIPNLNLHY